MYCERQLLYTQLDGYLPMLAKGGGGDVGHGGVHSCFPDLHILCYCWVLIIVTVDEYCSTSGPIISWRKKWTCVLVGYAKWRVYAILICLEERQGKITVANSLSPSFCASSEF